MCLEGGGIHLNFLKASVILSETILQGLMYVVIKYSHATRYIAVTEASNCSCVWGGGIHLNFLKASVILSENILQGLIYVVIKYSHATRHYQARVSAAFCVTCKYHITTYIGHYKIFFNNITYSVTLLEIVLY